MSKVELNIEDHIYVTLDIQSAPTPPTMNILKRIELQDGFGIAIPTLRLELYDQKGSLMNDLMLTDATKITITLSKRMGTPVTYNYTVFNFGKKETHVGPILEVICLLDVPKYSCAIFRKAYKGTSASAMGQVAKDGGLIYDGPDAGTSDNMKWLNVCETLSSFSEDMYMYGYSSEQSCMSRVVTSEKILRYKELFSQIQKPATATIRHNVPLDTGDQEGAHFTSREIKDVSIAGVMNHFLNYGFTIADHRLEGHQNDITKANPVKLGQNLPINSEQHSNIAHSRIEYGMHYDPGHAPKPAYNIHAKWNEARYQNLRYLALFTERLRVLVEDHTEVSTFDPINFYEAEYEDETLTINRRTTGKYLCGGKTITIINGSRLYEVFDLYRPYLNNQGNTPLL